MSIAIDEMKVEVDSSDLVHRMTSCKTQERVLSGFRH